MKNNPIEYIVFGENHFQAFTMVFKGLLQKRKWYSVSTGVPSWMNSIFFLKKYLEKSVVIQRQAVGKYKQAWQQLNDEAIELVEKYYSEVLSRHNNFEKAYNLAFQTNKFSAYIKDSLVHHCFKTLGDLFLIDQMPQQPDQKKIHLVDTPFNRFVVNHLKRKNNVADQCIWVKGMPNVFLFGVYAIFFLKSCIERGVSVNSKKKAYRVAKESTLGFHRDSLRDDLIVDGRNLTKKDLLLIELNNENPGRVEVYKKAQEFGYDTVSVPRLKFNVNAAFFSFLNMYLWLPLQWLFILAFSPYKEIYYYLFIFHKHSFPLAVLMQSYRIKLFILSCDIRDIDKTIVLNRYGTQVCLLHWSDIVDISSMSFAYGAHNMSFNWGDIYKSHHDKYRKVDRSLSIGCVYRQAFSKSIQEKNRIISMMPKGFDPSRKTVLFCDTSFSIMIPYSEEFFLDFMKVIRDFCLRHPNINVLYKPKNRDEDNLSSFILLKGEYLKVKEELSACANFIGLDPRAWAFEVPAALANVIVSMAMNTTSTVALICGKDALYYDTTGNKVHPIARDFFNSLVFDNQEALFVQVENILQGRFRCRDIVGNEFIHQFDPFDDDRAIDRLRGHVYEMTRNGVCV